ncbi:MAG TPA: DNA uptake protein [Cyanobacteria bacterium UBA11149]|nr:DNA uptake protein [Cyanobacteria bacterium UBA11366]HBR73613.1 DNA uptake protein [Cyanobacteria bacterium UBA11159]HBS70206.1 DNA uptake protein [Cyanobacteria bacterium UBA11153]HBW90976.1 DNA uptake protein [Cyanobacteria bacterium UBA11149]HCA94998.1 DNA uptake protein [Cyanobacteria bacterium UBA9226]
MNPNWQDIRVRIQRDPYYRLGSADEIAIAAELGIKIDVNQASVDDWLRLPGISIHQARCLVELVESGMQFYSLEDIAAAISVPVQRLMPLKPILQFCYYDPESTVTPTPINPNIASVEELAKIPLVDLFLARAIAQNRQDLGKYRNLADFQRRLALSPQLTSQLMHYLRF